MIPVQDVTLIVVFSINIWCNVCVVWNMDFSELINTR